MSARLLDGRDLAKEREGGLAERVNRLKSRGIVPRLVVLLGERAKEGVYFRAKERVGARVGIAVEGISVSDGEGLLKELNLLASDPAVSGIMVEAPLPPGIDPAAVRDLLPPEKDVDGGGIRSLGRLVAGAPSFPPATAAAVIALLDGYGIDPVGKDVVIIGRSLVVGRPLALLFLNRDATVTVCHSRTRDIRSKTLEADIVCVAAGSPGLLKGDMIRPGAVVVDVGTNPTPSGLVGDVDSGSVAEVAGWLSPVPGGVGPLTTVILMEHVATAAERMGG